MGYALITAEIGEGRYTIELDWGEAQRVALADAAATALASLDIKIGEQQEIIDAADAAEAMLQADLAETFVVIAEQLAAAPGTSAAPAQKLFEQLLGQLRKLQAQNSPKRVAMRTLKGQRALAVKRLAVWNNLVCLVTRNAWCADLTQDATGYVATLEIPGESDLVLIEPGAPVPFTNVHGAMQARELMSPEQAFFNVAILPGWQKFLPTFRWGTITAIDEGTETVTVALFAATSSAQRLGVNQDSTLSGVAVEYMECGYSIFEVGDRVVVRFENQDWQQPRVIGFLDNPRGCTWSCIGSFAQNGAFVFRARTSADWTAVRDATWQFRLDGGAWGAIQQDEDYPADPLVYKVFQGVHSVDAYTEVQVVSTTEYVPEFLECPFGMIYLFGATSRVGSDITPPPRAREVWEVRAVSGDGALLFNAAVQGTITAQEAGSSLYFPHRVRARGGIELLPTYEADPALTVATLEYTLTGLADA